MSGIMSKRQQARNEKVLQELVQKVPGNNVCADCHARTPAWASWSLGVFLCMRCAAIHRKLGTHISKVKSLSMDSWTNEQVDNMRKVGNVVSNQIYNAEGRKPPVPIDVDEADSAMERFIRQKYMNNVARSSVRQAPGSPGSDEGIPPPLPPKNSSSSSKSGLRSVSSLFPRSKKDSRLSPSPSPASDGLHRPVSASQGSTGKVSRMFGASVSYDDGDDMDRKLAKLRDMGFYDTQRNQMVLKGVGGNLEKAIQSLVRLGEGDGGKLYAPPPPPHDEPRPARSLTPLSSTAGDSGQGQTLGLSMQSSQPTSAHDHRLPSPAGSSTNPFDAFSAPAAAPQTAQSTGSQQSNNPYNQSLNPFGAPPPQPTDHFTQAFQNLGLSPSTTQQQQQQQQQPLFPNRTGGLTPQSTVPASWPQQMPAPSAPASPQVYRNPNPSNYHSMTYPQPQQQPALQPQPTGYNPFFANTQAQQQPQQQQQYYQAQQPQQQQHLTLNTQQAAAGFANNPFAPSPTAIASAPATGSLGQIPEQSQPAYLYQAQQQQQQQPMVTSNPFFSSSPMQTPTQAPQQQPFFPQQPQQQPQQVYAQQPRHDKASILALYGAAPPVQPAVQQPAAPAEEKPTTAPAMMSIPENQPAQHQAAQGTNNPFLSGGGAAATKSPLDDAFTPRKASRESVNLGLDMAWSNGRHSPDAFASLSARHG